MSRDAEKNRVAFRKHYAENKDRVKERHKRLRAERGHLWASLTPERQHAAQRRAYQKMMKDPVRKEIKRQQALKRDAKHRDTWKNVAFLLSLDLPVPEQLKLHSSVRKRTIVLDHYGSVCACCGESNPLFLTIDHTNNDGNIQRKELGHKRGLDFYSQIIKTGFPDDLQLLCWNCNIGKKNFGVCPHVEFSARLTKGVVFSGDQARI